MVNNNPNECQTCKSTMKPSQYSILILSVFILATSVYGTCKLVSNIIEYFSH